MSELRIVPKAEEGEPLLTITQAARRLSVGRSTVYRLIEARAFPHLRLGNCVRIRPADLEAYISSCEVRKHA